MNRSRLFLDFQSSPNLEIECTSSNEVCFNFVLFEKELLLYFSVSDKVKHICESKHFVVATLCEYYYFLFWKTLRPNRKRLELKWTWMQEWAKCRWNSELGLASIVGNEVGVIKPTRKTLQGEAVRLELFFWKNHRGFDIFHTTVVWIHDGKISRKSFIVVFTILDVRQSWWSISIEACILDGMETSRDQTMTFRNHNDYKPW